MKKSVSILTIIITLVFATNFISAAQFSLGNSLDALDGETVLLLTVFIIVLAASYLGASRVFSTKQPDGTKKPNKFMAAPVALAIAFATMYGANQLDFDFGIGAISTNFTLFNGWLGIIIPVILFIGIIYMIKKLKLESILAVSILFIIMGLLHIAYEDEQILWWGIILLIIYIVLKVLWWILFKRKKRDDAHTGGTEPPPTKEMERDGKKIETLKKRAYGLHDLKQKYRSYQFALTGCGRDLNKARRYYKTLKGILDYAMKKHKVNAMDFLKKVGKTESKSPSRSYQGYLYNVLMNKRSGLATRLRVLKDKYKNKPLAQWDKKDIRTYDELKVLYEAFKKEYDSVR